MTGKVMLLKIQPHPLASRKDIQSRGVSMEGLPAGQPCAAHLPAGIRTVPGEDAIGAVLVSPQGFKQVASFHVLQHQHCFPLLQIGVRLC